MGVLLCIDCRIHLVLLFCSQCHSVRQGAPAHTAVNHIVTVCASGGLIHLHHVTVYYKL